MVMAVMKRARVVRAMVMAMRMAGNKEDEGSTGHSIGDEGGV
jgi:hypothetical protein